MSQNDVWAWLVPEQPNPLPLIGLLFIAWWIVHFTINYFLFAFLNCCFRSARLGDVAREAYSGLSVPKKILWRRLLRAMVYYVIAVCYGSYLMCTQFRSLEDLFFKWGPQFELPFAIGAANFAVSMFEDVAARETLGRYPTERNAFLMGYLWHHSVTVAVYTWVLFYRQMACPCVFGLLYELPLLFSTPREFIHSFSADFGLWERVDLKFFWVNWKIALLSLIPFRLTSIATFVFAALFWRDYLSQCYVGMQIFFWFAGISFTLLNYGYLYELKYFVRLDVKELGRLGRMDKKTLDDLKGWADPTWVMSFAGAKMPTTGTLVSV